MRQVPRDELDRVVSHIAAYDKEEFAEFVSVSTLPLCWCSHCVGLEEALEGESLYLRNSISSVITYLEVLDVPSL